MIKILSSPSCSQCKVAKMMLEREKLDYQEINVSTNEGINIAKKHSVVHLPFFLIDDTPVENIQEVLRIVKG